MSEKKICLYCRHCELPFMCKLDSLETTPDSSCNRFESEDEVEK